MHFSWILADFLRQNNRKLIAFHSYCNKAFTHKQLGFSHLRISEPWRPKIALLFTQRIAQRSWKCAETQKLTCSTYWRFTNFIDSPTTGQTRLPLNHSFDTIAASKKSSLTQISLGSRLYCRSAILSKRTCPAATGIGNADAHCERRVGNGSRFATAFFRALGSTKRWSKVAEGTYPFDCGACLNS